MSLWTNETGTVENRAALRHANEINSVARIAGHDRY
jgi:hypothetical protein